MAVWWGKFEYELTKRKLDHTFHFNWSVKMILLLLLLPIMVHYTILMCASIAVAYAVHRDALSKEKILSLILFVLWSFAGFLTSLFGLINLFKIQWFAIIIDLASLFMALLLEYSLTIYECPKLKFSAFAHIMIIFQFLLIAILSLIAIRLMRMSKREKESVVNIEYD